MAVKRHRGKWVVEFKFDGKRLRRVSPVQTKRGAQQYEIELRLALSTSTPCSDEPGAEVPRLAEFAPEWLTTYAAVNNKASEVIAKESVLRVHLLPFFGNRRLDEIRGRDIERYKADRLKRGLSPKTVNNHLTVLRKLLVTAQEWEMIEHVPRVRRLKAAMPDFDWLRPDESRRFLAAVERYYPQWKALFWTALRTGLRRGELFALEWDAVDLPARRVDVRQSVNRGRLTTPKSGKGRSIPLSRRLTVVLAELRAGQPKRVRFLFPGADGGLTTHQDHVDRPLKGALKKAGLRSIRFHDLRHSFASQLISAGRSLKEVQELLGHSTLTMTLRYAHLAPERMRQAIDALDALDSQPSDG